MQSNVRSTIVVALVVAVAVGGALLIAPLLQPVGGGSTTKLALVIAWNSSSGSYGYSPSSIQVPAGATVEMTITNFDPVSHSVAPEYCRVNGTLDGMMWYGMGPSMMGSIGQHHAGSLPSNSVSHTFTVSGPGFHLNVPIPPAAGSSDPAVVSVTFHAPIAGTLSWTCEAMGPGEPGGMMGNFYTR